MQLSRLAIAVLIVICICASLLSYTRLTTPDNIVTTMQPVGTVVDLKDCRTGKNSLRCVIRTTTHVWTSDVTDWPGDMLQRGDVLAMRVDESGTRRDHWVCKNGMCRSQGTCWNWMPCWRS